MESTVILEFPTPAAFRAAVADAVGVDLTQTVEAAFAGPLGPLTVKSRLRHVPAPWQALGVVKAKAHAGDPTVLAPWPLVLPLEPAPVPAGPLGRVLFVLPAAGLARLVELVGESGEMRLGASGEDAMVLATDPPLLAALRADGAAGQAYTEQAPGVWVALGHAFPKAGLFRAAADHFALVGPGRRLAVRKADHFVPVAPAVAVALPRLPAATPVDRPPAPVGVRARLAPSPALVLPQPTAWVLTDDPDGQLAELVREAPATVVGRLELARTPTRIVLRTRGGRADPPAVGVRGVGLVAYSKLPNLLVPVESRLVPPLRRDAVRKLLAPDPARLFWLLPDADGRGFVPESVPVAAFAPLADLVDYQSEAAARERAYQPFGNRFALNAFYSAEAGPDDEPVPQGGKVPREKKVRVPTAAWTPADRAAAPAPAGPDPVPVQLEQKPDELRLELRALEDRFRALDGPPDAPERLALWPAIARLSGALGDKAEASLAWAAAVWELPEVPAAWAAEWASAEVGGHWRGAVEVELKGHLAAADPSPAGARETAALLVALCRQAPPPAWLGAHLPAARQYVERHEEVLGIRVVWLAWWHLAHAGGAADVLALARTRDRVLKRLLEEGLNRERDLPYFLRTGGEAAGERLRLVRDRLARVRELALKWQAADDVKVNRPYTDLVFAFGLAKLGEVTAARSLVAEATRALTVDVPGTGKPDPAHAFLSKALGWRVENVIGGRPHAGPLSPELLAELAALDANRTNRSSKVYVVNRFRQESWVLEPQEKVDPYAEWGHHGSGLQRQLAELAGTRDPEEVATRFRELLRAHPRPEERLLILAEALPVTPRAGEEFAVAAVQQVSAAVAAGGDPAYQTQALERALFLAAHYSRPELVRALFDQCLGLLAARDDRARYAAIARLAREGLRGLRKLGLKDDISRFLTQMTELVVRQRSLPQLKKDAAGGWPTVLTALLHLAEGWLYFGGYAQARPFLDEARAELLDKAGKQDAPETSADERVTLARTYVTVLGRGPIDDAMARIEEVFARIGPVPNAYTTGSHFSRLHLTVVEDAVRTLVADDVGLGETARRWLDDDEYLVRRRIHRDLQAAMAAARV
jgi:hypothetical protein